MSGITPRGGTSGDFFYLTAQFTAQPNGTLYYMPGQLNDADSTEGNRQLIADFGFLLRRLRTRVTANAATGDTVIAFRRNNVTRASVTFATTITGTSVRRGESAGGCRGYC